MGRKLKVTVYLDGGVDGRPKALLAGSEPTAEEAEAITNPDVWEEADEEASTSSSDPAGQEPARPKRRQG